MIGAALRTVFFIVGVIAITTLEIVHTTLFDYPMSLINIPFLILLVSMFVFETRAVVPLSLVIFFIVDLYSVLTPFGIVLIAGTLSILFAFWLHRDIFTNRSWLAAAGISLACIACYRVMYVLLTLVLQFLQQEITLVWERLFTLFMWEVGLTSLAVGIIVLVLSFFIQSLRLNAIDQPLQWLR